MDFNEPRDEYQSPENALTVSELTSRIKSVLERSIPATWVCGEVSNLSRPRSGHIYLTLKDESAQIRAAIWRTTASQLKFEVRDGLEVMCLGELDVYPPHGGYQLIVRQIQPKGIGALELAFQQLHRRLANEGLFAEQHKRVLPRFPRRIAFVTSPTGAAIRDFLEVAKRRWQAIEVLVIPARVQGPEAATEIADGIHAANNLAVRPDVLVVGRGGGSLEDLWCFNEEEVVRAIFSSTIPIVSAVGHEIDVTLSDLVADVRALTPSEAAERVIPSQDEVRPCLQSHQQRLIASLRTKARQARSRLDAIADRRALRKPFELVQGLARRVEDLQGRGERAVDYKVKRARDQLGSLTARLESLSPLAVLGRGYSITEHDGQLVVDANKLSVGNQISTRLAHGTVVSRVEETHDGSEPS